MLFEVETQVSEAHDLDELLERILRHAMRMVGAEAGSIALREGASELVFRTTAGMVAERVERRAISMGDGVIGWVAAQREPLISNDPAGDPRHAVEFADSIGSRPRNILCAPLVTTDDVLGAIELLDKTQVGEREAAGSRGFTESDLKLLVLIAGQASKAIQLAKSKHDRDNQTRLASIGQMLAGVLHDLKTPMTIISGYAQLMAQIDEAPQREQYVDQILRQFDLMSGMTREVLAFARGETNVLVRKVYLHKFLDEAVAQLRHDLAGRDVEVVLDAQYRGIAYFDEQKMLRVTHNLARNAAQAMAKAGGQFRIVSRADDKYIYLDFKDNGPGIPKEMRGRLFELFASGHAGGTGLGLAIVKKIVEEHRGEITYDSKPGEGTMFTVRLMREKPAGIRDGTGEVPVYKPGSS